MQEDGTVTRNGTRIDFHGVFRPHFTNQLFRCIHDIRQSGVTDHLIFNFSDCTDAYPNSMLPTICAAGLLREYGTVVTLALPRDRQLRGRFVSTRWATLIAPQQQFSSDHQLDHTTVVYQFRSHKEHYRIEKGILETVLSNVVSHRSAFGALGWVLTEVMDNVLNHSNSKVGGYVQIAVFTKQPPKINVSIVDAGKGILASLKDSYRELASDADAIKKAVQAGVTRDPEVGQGNGLSGSLGLAVRSGGWFRIISGRAQVLWTAARDFTNDYEATDRYPGTAVDLQLPLDHPIDLVRILNETTIDRYGTASNYSPTDYIEDYCLSDDGSEMVLRVAGDGSGTRIAGRELRVRLLNLLNASPTMAVVINWDGVEVLASSFADEFIGKVAKELGPDVFRERIKMHGLSDTNRGLVEKAIYQRALRP